MSRIVRTVRTALTLALALSSVPQVSEAGAEPIIITATKTKTPIRQIGSSVSLLTKDDLDRQGAIFALDALRTLPGISISQNGGPGGVAALRIRGEEAYRTLVLYDGIRISDAAAPQVAANLTALPAASVGRIEIVRGAQSLLYGADAVGGVVQILSPEPAPGLGFTADTMGGAYRTRSAAGALLYGAPRWGAVLQASHYKSGGFSAKEGDPDLADPDGLSATALHGKVHVDLSSALRLEAVGHTSSSDAEFDGASAFPPFSPADPNRLLKTRETAGRLELQHSAAGGRVETALSYGFSKSGRDDLSNGLPFTFGSKFAGTRRRTSLLSTIAIAADHSLLIGADQERLGAQTDAVTGRSSAYGVYAEWQAGFAGRFYSTIGLRFDHGDTFGDHVSGRATAAYLIRLFPAEDSRLHASFGTGFRSPSLFEQATNLGAALPMLHEEQSRGFDLGLNQSLWAGALNLDITYFDQAITHEIRFDNLLFTGYFQSAGRSQSRGVEVAALGERKLSLGWLSALRLEAAYTFTDARVHSPDAEDGMARVRRPRHTGATALTLLFGEDRADLTLSVRTAKDAQDGFREFRVPLDDYVVINMAARWRLTRQVELFATGVNLANEQYQEVAGFASSDAALYIGARVRL
jgi:vitamin B12 transporter